MPSTTLLTLPTDEVHLWYLLTERVTDRGLLAEYEGLLAPAERVRRDRYRFEHSRREYLLTRALVRTTLSRYAPVAPAAWTFRENKYGRPEIDPTVAPPTAHSLRFNLSNTQGLIACVVALTREVGVDVEDTQRPGETVGIADSFFAPPEVKELRALRADLRRSRFFDYWTLKEAYIKARGMGLQIPLDQFWFVLDAGPRVRIGFGEGLDDDEDTWQFEQFKDRPLSPGHRTAAAVRRGSDPDLRFVVRHTVPLVP
jgi:4'-phosphopantetheinyl transferase